MEDTYLCPAFTEAHARILKTLVIQYMKGAVELKNLGNRVIGVSELVRGAGLSGALKKAPADKDWFGEARYSMSFKARITDVRFRLADKDLLGCYLALEGSPKDCQSGLTYSSSLIGVSSSLGTNTWDSCIQLAGDLLADEFEARAYEAGPTVRGTKLLDDFERDTGFKCSSKSMAKARRDLESGAEYKPLSLIGIMFDSLATVINLNSTMRDLKGGIQNTVVGSRVLSYAEKLGPQSFTKVRFVTDKNIPLANKWPNLWVSEEWIPIGALKYARKDTKGYVLEGYLADAIVGGTYISEGSTDYGWLKPLARDWVRNIDKGLWEKSTIRLPDGFF